MDKNGMRVLVIDNDPETHDFLKKFFDRLQCEMMCTGDHKEGLRQLVVNPPDVVFLSVTMPDKDGLAVLKEIKELDKEVSVAIIATYAEAARGMEALKLGAIDCLFKPFNPDYITNGILPKVKVRPK